MTFSEIFWGLAYPWVLMKVSLSFLPSTVHRLFNARQFDILFSPSRLRDAWFSSFWAVVGPRIRDHCTADVTQLLDGKIRHGLVIEDSAVVDRVNGPDAGLHGRVLEVGAGTGMWVPVLAKYAAPPNQNGQTAPFLTYRGGKLDSDLARQPDEQNLLRRKVTKIFGIEPNPGHHAELQRAITSSGIDGVYEIVPFGIEDLAKTGMVEKESIDCIVTVLSLCTIPDPQHNINELYGYLKPGGKWYVYEHVQSDSWVIKLYQAITELLWPHFIGGCHLSRDTPTWLKNAGPWTKVDLAHPKDHVWWSPLPHICGVLEK